MSGWGANDHRLVPDEDDPIGDRHQVAPVVDVEAPHDLALRSIESGDRQRRPRRRVPRSRRSRGAVPVGSPTSSPPTPHADAPCHRVRPGPRGRARTDGGWRAHRRFARAETLLDEVGKIVGRSEQQPLGVTRGAHRPLRLAVLQVVHEHRRGRSTRARLRRSAPRWPAGTRRRATSSAGVDRSVGLDVGGAPRGTVGPADAGGAKSGTVGPGAARGGAAETSLSTDLSPPHDVATETSVTASTDARRRRAVPPVVSDAATTVGAIRRHLPGVPARDVPPGRRCGASATTHPIPRFDARRRS